MIFGSIQMRKFKRFPKQGIFKEDGKMNIYDENANEAMDVIDEKPNPFAIMKWLTIRETNFKQTMIFLVDLQFGRGRTVISEHGKKGITSCLEWPKLLWRNHLSKTVQDIQGGS